MPQPCKDNFACIESAQEFLALLMEAISETKRDVDADIQQQASANGSRRTVALRIASYDLDVLEHHLRRSKRLLNDLRMVRRLLLQQRGIPEDQLPAIPDPMPPVRTDLPRPPQPFRTSKRPERRDARREFVSVAAA